MKQWNRKWRLEIGSASDGIAIEDLRVAFEIKKTITPEPNPGSIKIWNMNRSHMNNVLDKTWNRIKLSVAYDKHELSVLYIGDVVKPRVKRDGVDFIIELECGSGFDDSKNAHVLTTLSAGASESDVMNAALGSMKSTKGTVDIPKNFTLPRARVLNGNTKDILGRMGKQHGADWSVQDGQVIFLPQDKVLPGEAFEISQDTGMIGAPEQTDDGLELNCLLNPLLRVGAMIRLRSIIEYFNGDYKIVSLEHAGDGHSGDWLSKLVVVGGKFKQVKK